MPVAIPVYFDYASSLCFIAAQIGRQLETELGCVLDWRPVSIAARHPEWAPGSPVDASARARIERVAAETGVALRIPQHWPDSRAALEGALFARDHHGFREYHDRVFAAAFIDGKDIADRQVLTEIARDCGLPMGDFMLSIATRARAGELAATAAEAARHGVAGYPAFLLGDFPLVGIQPLETMRLLFQRHLARWSERTLH